MTSSYLTIPQPVFTATPAPTVEKFSCGIYNSFEDLGALLTSWDEAVLAFGGSVYMTLDWCRTWWRFYGSGRRLRIVVFRNEERIVGLIPLYLEDLGIAPLRLRVARLVGSNIPPKVFNPPVDPAWAELVFDGLAKWAFGPGQCDILSLGPISSLHIAFDVFPKVAASLNDLVIAPAPEQGVHSVFWLPPGMEEYFEALSKNERKNRRKYELRLLRKDYNVVTDVLSEPPAVEAEFERFVPQHTAQWGCQGKPGHFGAWPDALEFNRALVQAQCKLGRTRFIRILADNQVISSQYAFAFGDSYFWELPARATGDQWERFSLGPTGIVTMIAAGITEGRKRIEGGLAHYDYKLRLNAREHATRTFRLISARPRSRVASRVLNLWRLSFLLGYHKIWYRRVAPHLPRRFWGPQWKSWLKLDF